MFQVIGRGTMGDAIRGISLVFCTLRKLRVQSQPMPDFAAGSQRVNGSPAARAARLSVCAQCATSQAQPRWPLASAPVLEADARPRRARRVFLFVHCPDCAKGTPTRRHVWSKSWQPTWWGTGHMTYYYDAATAELEHEFERLRFKQRHRMSSRQEVLPAVKMLIGDWYVDELGILTREITARD